MARISCGYTQRGCPISPRCSWHEYLKTLPVGERIALSLNDWYLRWTADKSPEELMGVIEDCLPAGCYSVEWEVRTYDKVMSVLIFGTKNPSMQFIYDEDNPFGPFSWRGNCHVGDVIVGGDQLRQESTEP